MAVDSHALGTSGLYDTAGDNDVLNFKDYIACCD